MKLIIKGFIIGIGKIIPGVSGALLSITLGVYEPLLDKIAHIKKDPIKNVTYLAKLGTGIIISIIVTSKIIVKCLENYYFPTMLLFIGMIIGGTKEITNNIKIKKKDIIVIILLLVMILFILSNLKQNVSRQIEYTIPFFISMIGIGFIDAASSIIPGISGTAILISLGYYNIVLGMFSSIINIKKIFENLFLIIPFSIGMLIGIITISKIVNYFFKHYKNLTYTVILIFIILTTIILVKSTFLKLESIKEIVIGIPLFLLGIYSSIKLGNK